MNPGPMEEGAKVASGFIEGMKGNPLALALAVSQILVLLLFFYIASWAGDNRKSEFAALQEMQREVQKMLFNCTPTRPQG